jgi:hypothetical protein
MRKVIESDRHFIKIPNYIFRELNEEAREKGIRWGEHLRGLLDGWYERRQANKLAAMVDFK